MTELVVGVRLKADGSGLVGQLTELRDDLTKLRDGAKGAADGARDLSQASDVAGKAARDAGAAVSDLATKEDRAASAARDASRAHEETAREVIDLGAATRVTAADLDQLKVGETGAAAAARELSRSSGEAARANRDAAKAVREEYSALAEFRKMLDPAAVEQARLNQQLEIAANLHRKGLLTEQQHAEVQRRLTDSSQKLTTNLGLQRAGYQQLGFQMQDVFASYASGTRLSVIAAQQVGQFGSALALIGQSAEGSKGKFAGFASFIGGPWGIAITVGASIVTALASTLFNAAEVADQVKFSTSSLSDSQGILGNVMEITTGKMKDQTDAAMALAFAQAQLNKVNAQKDAAKFRSEVSNLQKKDAKLRGGVGGGLWWEDVNPGAQKAIAQGVIQRMADPSGKAGISSVDAVQRLDNLRKAGALTEDAYIKAASSVANLGVELENIKIADATLRMLRGEGTGADRSLLLKPDKPKKPKKDTSAEKAAREMERLAQFSERAEESIARLDDSYNTAPRDIDKARQATADLDGIIRDVNKRLETGKILTDAQKKRFDDIKASAAALKPVIQDSLARPIRDMLDDQRREIDLGKLRLSGREADAQALQVTYGLMDKLGVESEAQLAVELAKRGIRADEVQQLYGNLGLLRQQTKEMQSQQSLQQAYLTSVNDMRENVRQTLEGLRSNGPKAFGDFFKRSLQVADRLFADMVTEKFFGSFFRDLEDQVTGADQVSEAGEKMATAVEKASVDILDLGKAAKTAVDVMAGKSDPAAVPPGWILGDDGKAFDPLAPIDVVGAAKPDTLGAFKSAFREGYEDIFSDLKSSLKGTFNDVFGDSGIFSASVSKSMGRALGGAQIGGAVGKGVSDALGIKGSAAGGALGGAAGSFLEGSLNKVLNGLGPFGSIIGGIAGSLVGGLLKKSKTGSATIGNVNGEGAVTGTSGNTAAYRKASEGLAGNVLNSLDDIVERLGGTLGSFSVSVGYKKSSEPYRVDTTGQGRTKGAGVQYFTDEGEAQSAALANAIADGAVGGVSAAIRKALTSSEDVSKAVAEALKVQEVEQLLNGLGSQMQTAFREFENQAKSRLRVATQYGFDVVQIEKRNAEDRAKLVEDLLSSRVGSLQSLLNDLKSGSLFEGSAVDQRKALMVQIDTARTNAAAGKDGAADQLATLSRQLVELSREAFGTAGGEYASDRASAISSAEAVIKAENDRIKAAQEAVAATNAKLDTGNAIATKQLDYLAEIAAAVKPASAPAPAPPPPTSNAFANLFRNQKL